MYIMKEMGNAYYREMRKQKEGGRRNNSFVVPPPEGGTPSLLGCILDTVAAGLVTQLAVSMLQLGCSFQSTHAKCLLMRCHPRSPADGP